MGKFWYLVKFALYKRVKTKAFVISNMFILLLTVALINMPNIIRFFGGEGTETEVVYVYDQTDHAIVFDVLVETQLAIPGFEGMVFEEKTELDRENIKDEMKDARALLVFSSVDGQLKVQYFTKGLTLQNDALLKMALEQVKVAIWVIDNPDKVDIISDFMTPIQLEESNPFDENPQAVFERSILGIIAVAILFPVFMLLTFLMQFVGMDILEEKSSRAIEVILSNVPATHHFVSKIVSSLIFLVIQGALLITYGFIGMLSMMFLLEGGAIGSISDIVNTVSTQFNIDPDMISRILARVPSMLFVTVIFTVVGFGFYAIGIAIFSAMSTNMEDFQQFQTPIMLMLVGSFYVALFSATAGAANFVKILAYIPLTSPMLAPVLFISGSFSGLNVAISLAILILSIGVLWFFGTPIYKVSILSYSQDGFFKRVYKMIKKSKYAD